MELEFSFGMDKRRREEEREYFPLKKQRILFLTKAEIIFTYLL